MCQFVTKLVVGLEILSLNTKMFLRRIQNIETVQTNRVLYSTTTKLRLLKGGLKGPTVAPEGVFGRKGLNFWRKGRQKQIVWEIGE